MIILQLWLAASFVLGACWALAGWVLGEASLHGAGGFGSDGEAA